MSTTTATPAPVTVSVTRRMTTSNDSQVLAWVHAGTALAEKFEGFLGTGWVRSAPGSDEWHMLYRFADETSLAAWEASDERRWWLSTGPGIVEHTHAERRVGIEGWFDEPSEVTHFDPSGRRAVPPRWKQALMIWSAFFPLSLLANFLLAPVLAHLALPFKVLLTTVILTPIMTYVMLPFAGRVLDNWLHKP